MATVSFEISTNFLTRMRAVVVAEQPSLQGQSNAVINEAARIRIRQMARDWVQQHEKAQAAGAVAAPGDADIL